jgi:hypothetical protein
LRCGECDGGLLLLFLQVREEGFGKVHSRGIVGQKFIVKDSQVDSFGFAKVEGPLDARVDEYTVDIRMLGEDFLEEGWNLTYVRGKRSLSFQSNLPDQAW